MEERWNEMHEQENIIIRFNVKGEKVGKKRGGRVLKKRSIGESLEEVLKVDWESR